MARLGGIFIDVRAKTDKYKRDLANAKTLTEKASIRMQKAIDSISFAKVAAAAAAFGAVVIKLGLDGFRAMEKFKLSAASLASTITSFAKDADKDLAGTYLQALGYSEQLVFEMEKLNAQTVATGENLTAMVETMAQGGVLLDINNKEQIKGFLAIANALALITQGQNQDIQFRQEIRGLIQGEVRATNMLARLLSQRVGGELKKHVQLWKEQGTLIESAGALLEGFQEGAKDLSNTWLAVGTTLQTMYDRTLRGLMAPVYEDIVRMGKEITLNILDQNSALNQNAILLKTVVFKGWQDIKNITESIVDVIAAFKDPLLLVGGLLGVILDGWGQIFAILPAITNRLKLMTQAIFDSVKWSMHLGEAFTALLTLDFKSAAAAWEASKDDWMESGRKTGEVFAGGLLDEIEARINTFNKDLTVKAKAPVLPPELKIPVAKTDDKDAKKRAEEALKAAEQMRQARLRAFDEEQRLLSERFHQEIEFMNAQIEKEKEQEEKRLEIVKSFNEQYNELGKTKFDIEREQVERMTEIYREAGIEENKIAQLTSDKNRQIAQAERQAKLSVYQDMAGGIAETFQMIAQAGGKQSLAAFRTFQAFAAIEAAIAGDKAVSLALADVTIPSTIGRFAMAGIAGAKAALQVGLILSAQPPSFDQGGISNAGSIFQTGNIREAHVPIPSGKIPVELNGGQEQKPPEVNIFNVPSESLMERFLASSRGQNGVWNIISSNPQRLKVAMQGRG